MTPSTPATFSPLIRHVVVEGDGSVWHSAKFAAARGARFHYAEALDLARAVMRPACKQRRARRLTSDRSLVNCKRCLARMEPQR